MSLKGCDVVDDVVDVVDVVDERRHKNEVNACQDGNQVIKKNELMVLMYSLNGKGIDRKKKSPKSFRTTRISLSYYRSNENMRKDVV